MHTPDDAIRHLRATDQRDQGRAETPETGPVTAERLAGIEALAVTVRAFNPSVVPGLLQTARYAAGAIKAALPALPAEEVQRRAHRRAARVDAWLGRWCDTPTVGPARFVIGSAALTQPLAGPQAHAQQLRHLVNLSASHSKLLLQILPEHTPVPGRSGQFSLYGLEAAVGGGQGVRVGYLETPVGGWYTTRSADVARLHTGFTDLTGAALTPADSRDHIQEVLRSCSDSSKAPTTRRPATRTPGTA